MHWNCEAMAAANLNGTSLPFIRMSYCNFWWRELPVGWPLLGVSFDGIKWLWTWEHNRKTSGPSLPGALNFNWALVRVSYCRGKPKSSKCSSAEKCQSGSEFRRSPFPGRSSFNIVLRPSIRFLLDPRTSAFQRVMCMESLEHLIQQQSTLCRVRCSTRTISTDRNCRCITEWRGLSASPAKRCRYNCSIDWSLQNVFTESDWVSALRKFRRQSWLIRDLLAKRRDLLNGETEWLSELRIVVLSK
jgi:hypothetical protein